MGDRIIWEIFMIFILNDIWNNLGMILNIFFSILCFLIYNLYCLGIIL